MKDSKEEQPKKVREDGSVRATLFIFVVDEGVELGDSQKNAIAGRSTS